MTAISDPAWTPAAPSPAPSPSVSRGATREIPPAVGFSWVMEGIRPYLGIGSVIAGVIAILLGWYGVSGQVVVAKQLPYLASGGILGVCLFILGGRLLLIQDLRRDSGRLDHVENLVEELHAVLLEQRRQLGMLADQTVQIPALRSVGGTRPGAEAFADDDLIEARTGPIRVVPGGATYHQDGCVMLAGKRVSSVKPATAAKRGLTPCPLCEPAGLLV